MQRLRTVTSLDVSAVAGHHAMPAALLFFFVGCFNCVQHVCPQMVAILHIETLVKFDFDLSLISQLITDSDLDRIKLIFGKNWEIIGLQNCMNEKLELFDPTLKNRK